MAPTMKELGIDRLNVEDRLTLVEEIWDSISTAAESLELTESQQHELDERIADLEARPNDVLTWDEIKTRIRNSP